MIYYFEVLFKCDVDEIYGEGQSLRCTSHRLKDTKVIIDYYFREDLYYIFRIEQTVSL
jgi:hypothetical protein